MSTTNNCNGNIRISNDVVAKIAGTAAYEVEGTVTHVNMLGKKNSGKGVKITVDNNDVKIDIDINVNFGVNIKDTALTVQKNVKSAVETMTGLNVSEINVFIVGVVFNKPEKTTKENGA